VRININIKSVAAALGFAGLALVAVGCASHLPEPGAADAMRAARLWPGTTVDDLHRGKQRYVQACSGCHGLFDPHEFASGRWPGFVKEMSGKLQLTSDELADLTRYLVVASESPPAAH
jgi:cytochrome c1